MLGVRRRGFEVTKSPSPAAISALGLNAIAIGSSPVPDDGTIDFYISTTGSDSNAGTISAPWAISALNTKRSTYTGNTVGLMDGTYDLTNVNGVNLFTLTGTNYYSAALDVNGGTALAPTVIKSVNARGAILSAKIGGVYGGRPTGRNQAAIMRHGSGQAQQGYLTIDGIKFTGFRTGAIQVGHYAQSSNLTGVVVQNCEFYDGNAQQPDDYIDNNYAVEFNNCVGHVLRNNYAHDNVGRTGTSTFEDHWSFVLQWCSRGGIYEYNTVVSSGSIFGKRQGWQSSAPSNTNTTIRYNYVENSSGFPGWVDHSQDIGGGPTLVHNNICYNANGALPMYDGESLGPGMFTPIKAYNNTFWCKSSISQPNVTIPQETAVFGQGEWYNNINMGSINSEFKGFGTNARAMGKCGYNLYPSSMSFRLHPDTANQTGDRSGTIGDFTTLATFRTAVQANGGLSTALMELNTAQSSQTLAQLFTLTGTRIADQFQLAASSAAKNFGRSDGTSSGSVVDAGAWGNLPIGGRVGCDFA